MRVATLLFYAVASFFLGTLSMAIGGPRALTAAVMATLGISMGPWDALFLWLTVGASVFFLAVAILAAVLQGRGRSID